LESVVIVVVGSDEFDAWFQGLDDPDADAVARVVDMLEIQGITLPYPYSSAIKGSSFAMREASRFASSTPSTHVDTLCFSSAATRPATSASTNE
jgi:hypothetical protein